MDIAFDTAASLDAITRQCAASIPELAEGFDPMVRLADPRFGDFQINGVLPAAKKLKTNPRALAQQLLDALLASDALDSELLALEIAGPGFINVTCTPAYRLNWLRTFSREADLKHAANALYSGKKVILDFSSPNTAKQMHVGHIRSTVIGEAVSRMLEFCGADTLRDNHIGDWGTQFGLIILGIKRTGFDMNAEHENPVAALEKIYKETHAAAKDDDTLMDAARAELVKLQQGDPESTALWEQVNTLSLKTFQTAYDRLGVRFDLTLGESFYRDKVQRVWDELTELGLAEESQGALVVFHPEHKRFAEQPFIIRKSDGASNYATTDLATVLYRVEELGAKEIIYLTDARQGDHFEQLFLTVKKWFEAKGYALPALHHLTFGTILGEDGKAIKTRSGEPVRLRDLLEESVRRATEIVNEKNPELPDDERTLIGERVGINALRYADLMQNRSTNYAFSWDKMLSFDGNTAPYLLYTVARIHSIFRKGSFDPDTVGEDASAFATDEENALARKLMAFPQVIQLALEDFRPHHMCTYLYELAGSYSSFYNANRVMVDEADVKARRLMLSARTLRTLETGLRLLGIEPLERM